MKHFDFQKKAKSALNQQAKSLKPDTLHRLRKARETALNNAKPFWFIKPSSGLALASVLAIIFSFLLTSGLFKHQAISPLEDLEILTSETDLDVILDTDFYQWLDDTSIASINET